ncbi:alpha/beta fold hydrolase [Salinarimonas ramus]|uniref:Alpha/beta hydrolase n=1 Tax=Salinarimonas ramus TaxID=690164 RepID=A0A917Q9E5_9HYPH|nr:alpha/beta fold hydrolase [Salinarimonas ramus]GGK36859.1 alpha/beta hydrolase [Salinarimonas ramus]
MSREPDPLVLLPGLACDARLFLPQIAALSAGRTIHVPTVSRADTITALAESVLAEAPPRIALCGLSMGGIVAMETVRLAPERVSRLALLDTDPRADSEGVRAMRETQIAEVEAGGLAEVLRRDLHPLLLHRESARDDIRALMLEMAIDLGPEAFVRQSRALASRAGQEETLRGYRGPTLVLCGEDDRLCPVKRHTLMHELVAGSVLEIVPGAGHLPTLEAPDAVNAALRTWLAA